MHNYISVSDSEVEIATLDQDERAFVVMEEQSVKTGPLILPGDSGNGAWKAMAAFVGLLGLGGIVRSMQNQHSGKINPPPAPLIELAQDDVGIYTGSLVTGGITDSATPEFRGTGSEPGNIITFYDDGVLIGSTLVSAEGNWSFTPEIPLTQGQHSFTATQTSSVHGKVSKLSAKFDLLIDTTPPDIPALLSVFDQVGMIQGPQDSGQPTNDARPVISGNAEPNSRLIILIDGATVGEVLVDVNGYWQWQPGERLADGQHSLTTYAIDVAGNISQTSPPFIINIDTVAPDQPAILTALDSVNGGIQDGNDVGNGGLTNDNRPVLQGRAEAGSLVYVYNAQGQAIASVTAQAGDIWSLRLPVLPEGENVLTITATDKAGNVSLVSEPYAFSVDTLRPDTPAILQALDSVAGGIQDGNDVGNGGLTNDNRPVLQGRAEAGSLVYVYNAQGQVIASVTAQAGDTWSLRLPALPEGENVLTITATDKAGNVSAVSEVFTLNVDTVEPDNPGATIGSADSGMLWNGTLTNDQSPQLSGTGEKNATVTIYQNGKMVDTLVISDTGVWNWQPEYRLFMG